MFLSFAIFILVPVLVAGKIESSIIIDLIHQFFPAAVHTQLIEDLAQNKNGSFIPQELNHKIQSHVISVLNQLPTAKAINNFLDQFPLDKQDSVQIALKEALAIGLTETINDKPPALKPLRPSPISPKRLQQIVPDSLQRDILEELFLQGGLEHLSPKLRRKVHEQMEQLRNAFVPPSHAMIEEFIQHFPLEIRQELRNIAMQIKATGRLPRADELLRSEIQYILQNHQSSSEERNRFFV